MSAQQAYATAIKDLGNADSDVELIAGRVRAPLGALVRLGRCQVTYKGTKGEALVHWLEFGQSINIWFWEGDRLCEAQTVMPELGGIINVLEIPINIRRAI